MSRLLFDIETDGLLPEVTKVHCLVIKDLDTGHKQSYVDVDSMNYCPINDGLVRLMAADELWGHNILLYDLPVLEKLTDFRMPPIEKVHDTLVLARLYHQDIKFKRDLAEFKAKRFPSKLMGRHSLEAWGMRLGYEKVGLDIEDWSQWTPYMQERCEQDVEVNYQLVKFIRRQEPWPQAELLEHRASLLCRQIESNGIPFDAERATDLYAQLCQMREDMASKLRRLFPDWVISKGEFTPKTGNRKTGNTAGCPFTRVEFIEFNPRSRPHVARCLTHKYAWEPVDFTEKGAPKIDEKVLAKLPYPEAKPLAELFLIEKRIGQIAEGEEAWLQNVAPDGMIHHRLNPNGAVTGRATHSKPNISQVPKVGSRYGKECRSFFHCNGWTQVGIDHHADGIQVGIDVAGLELRMLAHYMRDPAYMQAVVEGTEELGTDVHTLNCLALGLEPKKLYTVGGKQQTGRNLAKTFIYAFLYGAGGMKIGTIVGKGAAAGNKLKQRFLSQVPALGKLQEQVKKAAKRGYLVGLDGRQMQVRSEHAALNTLLQGAGAAVCKQWIVETDRLCREAGLKHGWDGDYAFMIWAHDELQIGCRTPEIADIVERAAHAAIGLVAGAFGIRLPLAVSAKRGRNWAECH